MAEKIPPTLQSAADHAQTATRLDTSGDRDAAIAEYMTAIDLLNRTVRENPLPSHQQDYCRRAMSQYVRRVEELTATGPDPSTPRELLPNPPATQRQLATRSQDPTLLETAYEASKVAAKAVNTEGGKVLRQGYQAAKEFDAKHDVSGTAARTAKAAYGKAKEIEEKHQVTQKVVTVGKAAVTKASEINREYRITERVGSALVTGLNYASEAASQYLNKHKAEDGAQAIEGRPERPPLPPPPTRQ